MKTKFEDVLNVVFLLAILCLGMLAVLPIIRQEHQDHLNLKWHLEHGCGVGHYHPQKRGE